MKTLYIKLVAILLAVCPVCAETTGFSVAPVDILKMETIPGGKYRVSLELTQLDGAPAQVLLESRDGALRGTDGRFGNMEGRVQSIGNGVFMVQLRGTGYVATQFWVFKPDGSAAIKEIPDRGEQQKAVPQ